MDVIETVTPRLSRRQFMFYVVAASVMVGSKTLISQLSQAQQLPSSEFETGRLEPETLANLMAMVDAFAGDYGSTGHYQNYFSWRAENLPGYKTTYELFSAGLDETARELAGQPFAESDVSVRRTILQYGLELPEPSSSLFDPRLRSDNALNLPVDEGLWLRFDRYIIGEMIYVFIHTNAWIMMGYDGWPSQPRGLTNYPLPLNNST